MGIEVQHINSVSVISFDSIEELYEPDDLFKAIDLELESGNKNVLIDMRKIRYVSSSVLGCFITSYKTLKEHEGHLKFLNVQPVVANMFEMTRTNRIFEQFNDLDTAVNSYS